MNNNSPLARNPEVAAKLACELLLQSPHQSKIAPGVVLCVGIMSSFKAILSWYHREGEGASLHSELNAYRAHVHKPLGVHLYVVDYTANRLHYLWRRRRLGNGHYLRDFRDSDEIHPELTRFKVREVFF